MQTLKKSDPINISQTRETVQEHRVPLVFDLHRLSEENDYFRRVVETTNKTQTVLMRIEAPGLQREVHSDSDQSFHVTSGKAEVEMTNVGIYALKEGDALTVPAGVQHEVRVANVGGPVRLWTVYSPPVHPAGTVQTSNPEGILEYPGDLEKEKVRRDRFKQNRKPSPKKDVARNLATNFDGSVNQDLTDMVDSML